MEAELAKIHVPLLYTRIFAIGHLLLFISNLTTYEGKIWQLGVLAHGDFYPLWGGAGHNACRHLFSLLNFFIFLSKKTLSEIYQLLLA